MMRDERLEEERRDEVCYDVFVKTYRDLEAWKNALELIKFVYDITESFPVKEQYGLTSQLRRAANSIAMNIAEGHGRFTWADRANKYTIARGECLEVEAGLLIAEHLSFVSNEDITSGLALVEQQSKLLSGMIRACKQRGDSGSS